MGNSLIQRCVGVMISPTKTFLRAAEDHNERHVVILSLIFGFLFAKHIIRSENRDVFVYITTSLTSGIGFIYFSGFFLAWLIQITGPFVHPQKMRMVMAYSLTPYILSLSLVFLSKALMIPKTGLISFALTAWSWGLAVLGIKTIGQIKLVQALMVIVLPVAALLLMIAVLFKIVWEIEGL